MGPKQWQQDRLLIEELLQQAKNFSLFPAMLLLEKQGYLKRVNYKPWLSWLLPTSPIVAASENEQGEISLQLTSLRLNAPQSHLPTVLQAYLRRDEPTANWLCALIEVINQRFYELFYRAWKAHRPYLPVKATHYIKYLNTLIGNRHENNSELMRYSQFFAVTMRSFSTLQQLLQKFLNSTPFTLREDVVCYVELEHLQCLSSSNNASQGIYLGDNAVLGQRALVQGYQLIIEVGPLPWPQAKMLLPFQPASKQLHFLLRCYLGLRYQFGIKLLIEFEQYQACLGAADLYLGWSSCLGQPLAITAI